METEVILGPAGSGKTSLIQRRLEERPKYAFLTSTSGISAINLGAGTTINSALGYFDTPSLFHAFRRGEVRRRLDKIRAQGYSRVVIDEISMMSSDALSLIYQAFDQSDMGLILTGDFLQLPPVDEPYAFESEHWPLLDNVVKLNKVWRQTDPSFLEAVEAARLAKGFNAVSCLRKAKVEFADATRLDFEGVTLFPVNAQVEKFNREKAAKMNTPPLSFFSERWGQQRAEWRLIPPSHQIKEDSLVMLLANQRGGNDTLLNGGYANGDLGFLVGADEVLLRRNGKVATDSVKVRRVVRKVHAKDLTPEEERDRVEECPWDTSGPKYDDYIAENEMSGRCYYDPRADAWVVGEIEYMPIRLAYACTIHKAQGLSLDLVQIDFSSRMMARPALAYTALTRCRTPEGLRVVGSPFTIAARFVNALKVKPFI